MEINTEVKTSLKTNHIIDLSDRLYKIILSIIALVAVYVIGQMAYDFKALPQNLPREIIITGEGKAYAKPDIAIVSFGATSQAVKSQDAVSQSNQKTNAVVKAIKELGVEDKDIKTTSYNLYPVYGYERIEPLYYPIGGNKITGYRLDQQIEVKIRNLDKINEIMDKATSSGANTVSSPQFTIDDTEKVKSEAREKAIAKAKEKALALANQAGLKIDRLVNISEEYNYPMYGYGLGGTSEVSKDVVFPAPQIEPGQTEVNVSVTLTYRIK